MKNLAIIGASYLQLPLIDKAKELGYATHVFAWETHDVGELAADYFYPVSITEKEKIADICREIGICGICSIASDLAAVTVNYVANQLGLPGNSMESTYKSTNKHLMRMAFEANGDPSPKSILVDGTTDLSAMELTYPVIVKPTDRSGSRGIYKLENRDDLKNAVRAAMHEGFEKKVLIEEFAEGQEYSVEGISFKGAHHILAVTLKYTTGAPHFIETAHREPAPVTPDMFKRISDVIIHALGSLGLQNGASHSEIKIDAEGNIKIIEIGGRMGGGCIGSDLVRYSTGIDYIKAVIDVACGTEPKLEPESTPFPAQVQFIITEEDHKTFLKLMHDNPQKILKIAFYHPEFIGNIKDESNRAGCYIVKD